ncbi:hypothetical protein B0T20DRAFT_427372 [Sordaria brevicollis]|uniref:Secreted protein n=1 Tax=Sordaria brevicollis TaxID=83679 RepID=A0AAE0U0S3_SORBR|nr:hypothetical protein B0T20DRAFT_427372 [Sordaria brevicollis]
MSSTYPLSMFWLVYLLCFELIYGRSHLRNHWTDTSPHHPTHHGSSPIYRFKACGICGVVLMEAEKNVQMYVYHYTFLASASPAYNCRPLLTYLGDQSSKGI